MGIAHRNIPNQGCKLVLSLSMVLALVLCSAKGSTFSREAVPVGAGAGLALYPWATRIVSAGGLVGFVVFQTNF